MGAVLRGSSQSPAGCAGNAEEPAAFSAAKTPDERNFCLKQLEARRPDSAAAREAKKLLAATKQLDKERRSSLETKAPERYEVHDPEALQHLSDKGYVVIKGVLEASEVATAHDLLWEFLRGATEWERGCALSWNPREISIPQMGILKGGGAGQSELVWFVRTRSRVKEMFAKIWGTQSLLSSFDGFNVFLPWHHLGESAKTMGGWLHADQGCERKGLQTIQGFVSLTDQDATTGGLHVIPGSHHVFDTWIQGHPHSGNNFCRIDYSSGGIGRRLYQFPQQLVCCRAGDLVFWDSRCVHCNTPSLEDPVLPDGQLLRVAVYVCLTPKSWASDTQLALRRQAYAEGVTCNHWPLISPEEFESCFRGNGFGYQVKPLDEATDGREELI